MRLSSVRRARTALTSRVLIAGIAYKDRLFLDRVASLRSRRARVDRVFVVEATAYRVAFGNLDAHHE